jgi:hypothetical protein
MAVNTGADGNAVELRLRLPRLHANAKGRVTLPASQQMTLPPPADPLRHEEGER